MTSELIEISHSRLQAYQRCPWMYHLIYNENWHAGPTAPMAFGQSLHQTLAQFFKCKKADQTINGLHEIFDSTWVNEGFSDTEAVLETYQRGRDILTRFFESEKNRQSEVIATEIEFRLDLEGIHLRGTIDRIDRNPDGSYDIIEYKSTRSGWPLDRIESDSQMTLYSIGGEKGLELTPLNLTFYFLAQGERVPTNRSDQQKQEILMKLKEVADAIRRKDFHPNLTYCRLCPFGSRCVNFKKPN